MNFPKIDFLIIGSAKCATTSFHHYLNAHPDIYLPLNCGINHETGFFLTPGSESIKGLTNDMIRKDVDRIFENYRDEKAVGERSTDYSKYPFRTVDFDKIKSHNPRMKFLYFVGDPVVRLKKLYKHHLTRNPVNTDPDFWSEMQKNGLYYQSVYSYYAQVKKYTGSFDLENIKIIDIDRLDNRIGEILSEIFRFLNVRDCPIKIIDKKFNVNVIDRDAIDLRLPQPMEERLKQDFLMLVEKGKKWGNYTG